MDKFVDQAFNKISAEVKKRVKEKVKEQIHGFGDHHAGGDSSGGGGFPGMNMFHRGEGGAPPPHAIERAHMPYPGQQPPGPGNREHLKVKNVTYHDRMQFYKPNGQQHDVARDLGYSGVLDGRVVWTFGDTLMGRDGKYFICAVDSTAVSTDLKRPLHAVDTHMNGDNVGNFINCNPAEQASGGLSCFAFGGTNIVEIAPNHGVCYYLKIHRPGGNATLHGAGVCKVTMQGDVPVTERCGDYMWTDREPSWGDVGIALDPRDNHLYIYGHGFGDDKDITRRIFLARVPKDQYHNIWAYEYWLNNRRQWTKQRLTRFGLNGTLKMEMDFAVWGWMTCNQSAPFWSNYFNCWMLLYGSSWGYSDVLCQTADRLEGPWKEHGIVAKTQPIHGEEDGLRYCHTGHPQFDHSGKTVLVTWTKNNIIWSCTIEWE